mgnify:CR=1 FL=1
MRVLILVPIWDLYGASQTARDLAIALAEEGHKVEIWAPYEYADKKVVLNHSNVSLVFKHLPIFRRTEIYSKNFLVKISMNC